MKIIHLTHPYASEEERAQINEAIQLAKDYGRCIIKRDDEEVFITSSSDPMDVYALVNITHTAAFWKKVAEDYRASYTQHLENERKTQTL